MKTLKKIVAWASAVALITMNAVSFTAYAAAVNDATAVVTPATSIAVTRVWAFALATSCSATITQTNAGWVNTSVTVDSCAITSDDVITVNASTVAANKYYTIAFSVDNGTFGTTTAWDTTNNVVVSARVLPILSMAVSNATVDLGVLSPTAPTNSTTDTTITVATNANGWYVVSAAATNFVGATTSHAIPFVSRSAQVAGIEGFSIDVASVAQWTNGTSFVAATAWEDTASTYVVANWAASLGGATAWNAGTTDGDQLIVNYAANISPVTQADNYSTTVTYSVSGSF